MSPLGMIKKGIEDGDLSLIVEGYQQLTGETVVVHMNNSSVSLVSDILAVLRKYGHGISVECLKQSAQPTKSKSPVIVTNDNVDNEEDIDDAELMESIDDDEEDEPPPSNLVVVGKSKQPVFGGAVRQQFVTQESVDEEEARKNRLRRRRRPKNTRQTPDMYQIECSECGKIFESPMKAKKTVGQRCGACLKRLSGSR